MQRTNIYLDEDQLLALKHVAAQQRRSVAAVVREAVTEYLTHSLSREETLRQLECLIEQIHARVPPDLTSDEIEADITAARDGVGHLQGAAVR